MRRMITHLCVLALAILSLRGEAADPREVMGNWEGRWLGDQFGAGPVSVQIIAEGKGNFRAVLSVDIGEIKLYPGEMRGKDEGGKVAFTGTIDLGPDNGGVYELNGEVAGGKFTGHFSGSDNRGGFELSKVRKVSETLGAAAPEAAVVLFDGKDFSKWQGNPWRLVDGAMEVIPGKGNIRTRDEFGHFKLHIEFRTPFEPEARGQGRGNSGVYLPGNNEVQVLDSFGLPPSRHDCGAFYGQAAPLVSASLPPEEWQTYDVTFIAPRFDDSGKCVRNARVTVLHNGVKIHDQFEPQRKPVKKGGILLQDHDNKVQYRNIWLLPLKGE